MELCLQGDLSRIYMHHSQCNPTTFKQKSHNFLRARSTAEIMDLHTQEKIAKNKLGYSDPAHGGRNLQQIGTKLQKGGGISSAAVGLRLRYEIRREFAPYIGVTYSNSFGKTASKYGGGEDSAFVAGLRLRF